MSEPSDPACKSFAVSMWPQMRLGRSENIRAGGTSRSVSVVPSKEPPVALITKSQLMSLLSGGAGACVSCDWHPVASKAIASAAEREC